MKRIKTTVKHYHNHARQTLIPCFLLSAITGILTGSVIFLFRICAEKVIEWSSHLYGYVKAEPWFIPILILAAVLIGLITYLIMRIFPNCRGGDSQTTIAILRGFIPIKWFQNTVVLFFTSLLAYFSGMPLGVEGTSTQLGAAIGKATVDITSKRSKKAWERYIMTGGACGGFAAAAFAPLTAILFAFDEAHRRFSSVIFMSATTATITSTATLIALSTAFGYDPRLFDFDVLPVMPPKYLWVTAIVGAVCGIFAVLFARLFPKIEDFVEIRLSKVPVAIKITALFVIVAVLGIVSSEMTGSGHHLIHDLVLGHAPIWWFMIILLFVRSFMFLLCGSVDIIGGLSVPAMTVGALIGSLLSNLFVGIGALPKEYAPVLVIVGVASFLAAVNRAPLNAITFAAEALMGFSNILGVIVGVGLAFIVIEPLGVTAFSDVLIEEKAHEANKGKKSHTIDAHMTAKGNAFITGKEARDVLWPANCIVLSVDKSHPSSVIVEEGDVLHMRYKTFDPKDTYETLESIIGKQDSEVDIRDVHENDSNYTLPEQ